MSTPAQRLRTRTAAAVTAVALMVSGIFLTTPAVAAETDPASPPATIETPAPGTDVPAGGTAAEAPAADPVARASTEDAAAQAPAEAQVPTPAPTDVARPAPTDAAPLSTTDIVPSATDAAPPDSADAGTARTAAPQDGAAAGRLAASLADATAAGNVSGAQLNWGIKTSFANYIAGPIAKGSWTTTGDVSQQTPFTWTAGVGDADPAGPSGLVDYGSSIRFTGHNGLLDLTFSDFRVRVTDASTAQIVVDAVYSETIGGPRQTADDVVLGAVALGGAASASTAGTISYRNAPVTLTAEGAVAFAGFYQAGSALDPVSFSWPVAQDPAPTPTISLSKTEVNPAGDTVTITGTGFVPDPAVVGTRPPLAGTFPGFYVVFGSFADTWRPSAGAASAARPTAGKPQKWVLPQAQRDRLDPAGTNPLYATLNADGSFSIELPVSRFADPLDADNYGIYTYAASGASSATYETFTPIGFRPTLSVTPAAGLDRAGQTVTVSGAGYDPTKSSYIAVCADRALAEVTFDMLTGCVGARMVTANPGSPTQVTLRSDGTFSFDFAVPAAAAELGSVAVFSIRNFAGMTDRSQDARAAIAFGGLTTTTTTLTASPATGLLDGASTTLSAAVSPAVAGSFAFMRGDVVIATVPARNGVASVDSGALPAGSSAFSAVFTPASTSLYAPSTGRAAVEVAARPASVGVGSLTWGVKQSFRDYVTGGIAKGSVITSGVGSSGGVFVFGQGAGGSFDGSVGTSPYTGSVRFTGHAGVLDLTLSNPVVRVDSATTGMLLVTVAGVGQVPFATLDLSAGSRSTPDNAVAYTGVPARLTAQGAGAFQGFYGAGEALDPVTFVIGSPGAPAGSGGGTTVTAAFAPSQREPAATPPATTGLTLQSGSTVVEGGEVTITADGFQPNETGILVVIYSDPTVLARDVTADANGVVTWTGRLPLGLTGKHTLTVQGSADRGIELDIPARAQAVQGCEVTAAQLDWGFKESFRSYISGSIANGQWTVADGATYETPLFGWSGGTGGYDTGTGAGSVSFAGSITFTGHGGVLTTTVANPRIEFVDESTASLLLDVSGTTQDGTAVSATAVEFATLDLSGASTLQDGVLSIVDAPAVLAAPGADAFGTYPAGESLDPVSLTVTLDDACATPAPVTPTAAQSGGGVEVASAGGPDLGWLIWAIAAVVLLAAAGLIAWRIRSRRA